MNTPDDLPEALSAIDLPPGTALVDARDPVHDWASAKAALMGAFEVSQRAARTGAPVVYLVHADDLLGRRGVPSAMVANGLMAAARTAAIELARKDIAVNVLAVTDATPSAAMAIWVGRLAEPGGPTGEVIHLDPGHLGKALS